jgi:hypothetical protein
MLMFLETIGRKASIINLDFANDKLPYKPAVDIRELISLDLVMTEHKLGPNGGLLYCMDYLLENYEWLEKKMHELEGNYVIFDFPGQVTINHMIHDL